MGLPFASGKRAIAECDICGFRYKLTVLRKQVWAGQVINTKVCPSCWSPDHPQLLLGKYPVEDPQAVREPRPDNSYYQSGPLANGSLGMGSRDIQWGWNPVGGGNAAINPMTPNTLVATGYVGTVTVTVGA